MPTIKPEVITAGLEMTRGILTAAALVLSLLAGGIASYFMGRRMAKMKPSDILRRL
jgi:uncharacterized membrane protein YfcA